MSAGTTKYTKAREDSITGFVASLCPFCGSENELDVSGENDKTCKHFLTMEWDKSRFVFDKFSPEE